MAVLVGYLYNYSSFQVWYTTFGTYWCWVLTFGRLGSVGVGCNPCPRTCKRGIEREPLKCCSPFFHGSCELLTRRVVNKAVQSFSLCTSISCNTGQLQCPRSKAIYVVVWDERQLLRLVSGCSIGVSKGTGGTHPLPSNKREINKRRDGI